MGTENKHTEGQGDTGSWDQDKPSYQNWTLYQDKLHKSSGQALHLEEAIIYPEASSALFLRMAPLKGLRVLYRRPHVHLVGEHNFATPKYVSLTYFDMGIILGQLFLRNKRFRKGF